MTILYSITCNKCAVNCGEMKRLYKYTFLILVAYGFLLVLRFTWISALTLSQHKKMKFERSNGNTTRQIHRSDHLRSQQSNNLKAVFGVSGKTKVLLFGAVAGNFSDKASWDTLFITGWTIKTSEMRPYNCCVTFSSGLVQAFPITNVNQHFKCKKCQVPMRQYICSEISFGHFHQSPDLPASVSLINKGDICRKNLTSYVDIVYPKRKSGQIAIFGKIVYGNVSALNLLSWFEIHKRYEFDKILMYTHGLNEGASKVLEYYRNSGLLETVSFSPPGIEHGVKRTPVGTKTMQGWNDDRVAYSDALERLRGYTYLVSIDIDEYLIPKRHKTWKDLFNDLWKANPDASHFTFKTYFYRKNAESSTSDSPFDVCRYLNRTEAIKERPKHVTMPDRIENNGLRSHIVYAKEGYKRFIVKEDDVVLRHYRSCKEKDKGTKKSCYLNRTHDDVGNLEFKKVEKDVLRIASYLGLFS